MCCRLQPRVASHVLRCILRMACCMPYIESCILHAECCVVRCVARTGRVGPATTHEGIHRELLAGRLRGRHQRLGGSIIAIDSQRRQREEQLTHTRAHSHSLTQARAHRTTNNTTEQQIKKQQTTEQQTNKPTINRTKEQQTNRALRLRSTKCLALALRRTRNACVYVRACNACVRVRVDACVRACVHACERPGTYECIQVCVCVRARAFECV